MLRRIYWLVKAQMGIDLKKSLRFILEAPRFTRDLMVFRRNYDGELTYLPCLHDRHLEGGTTSGEYFWQDLLVARKIFDAAPSRHIDIGSRIDGFVAHVASFREIEVVDVRPISKEIPGVIFRQMDLSTPVLRPEFQERFDSVSCLHALEHFGLGRYGDPIDATAFKTGIANFALLLKTAGLLYLSVPIGRERVEFNAHRIFSPRTILSEAANTGLALTSLTLIESTGKHQNAALDNGALDSLAAKPYSLGLFIFKKAQSDQADAQSQR